MDKSQSNKLSMYEAVYRLLTQSPTHWEGIESFSAAVAEFGEGLNRIRKTGVQQASVALGKGAVKEKSREDLAQFADVLGNMLLVMATDKAMSDLEKVVNNLIKGIKYHSTAKAHMRTQHLLELVHGHRDALNVYGLTDDTVEAFEARFKAFEEEMIAPRKSIVQRKALTQQLKVHFRETDELLKKKLDRLIQQFKLVDQSFFNRYTNMRMLVDYGSRSRHTDNEDDARGPTDGF